MRILIDVDDVLFPWFDKAHDACVAAGITNGVVPSRWECYLDYGVDLQTWLDVMEKVTLDGSLYSGEPYPDAVEAMHDLKDGGHSLHVVTARGFFVWGELIRAATVDWLHVNDVPHDSLTFTKDKSLIRADVAIDDSMRNVLSLEEAGVKCWLMDAAHNRHEEFERRVSSFREFADLILEGQ